MDVLLTIGDFSRMTYLGVKALRHYHEIGLLVPADIDPASGYRLYRPSQVPTARSSAGYGTWACRWTESGRCWRPRT